MSTIRLRRLGLIMEPEACNPTEAEGVLNPAAIRGPDGQLYLFPRLVARGNYSRIGVARVRFDEAGEPCGVERLGIALEPQMDYERGTDGIGGCEDPRVTFIETLGFYVMTYTALSDSGPRIALAASKDLWNWQRLGLATFGPHDGFQIGGTDNKDASFFPSAVPNKSGQLKLALLHRPLFPGNHRKESAIPSASPRPSIHHPESIWISYTSMDPDGGSPTRLGPFKSHHRLATPISPWERVKIGGGTPPILSRHGWLIVYHGVSETSEPGRDGPRLSYSAGVMVLSKEQPHLVRYRSAEPILTPTLPHERGGVVADIVFPTGIDRRDDLGLPDRFDVYYGMADYRIGVARLDMPEFLPPEEGMHGRRKSGATRHAHIREHQKDTPMALE